MKKVLITTMLVIVFATALYGYSQFLKKGMISAVLLQEIDLKNPPDPVLAISTYEQNLPDGKNLPKGTRLIGKLASEENGYVIYFNEIQSVDGKRYQFLAKSNLNLKESEGGKGVSAKIGKTLYQQTKTNVLGAIFNNSNNIQTSRNSILPRGSILKIEIN